MCPVPAFSRGRPKQARLVLPASDVLQAVGIRSRRNSLGEESRTKRLLRTLGLRGGSQRFHHRSQENKSPGSTDGAILLHLGMDDVLAAVCLLVHTAEKDSYDSELLRLLLLLMYG